MICISWVQKVNLLPVNNSMCAARSPARFQQPGPPDSKLTNANTVIWECFGISSRVPRIHDLRKQIFYYGYWGGGGPVRVTVVGLRVFSVFGYARAAHPHGANEHPAPMAPSVQPKAFDQKLRKCVSRLKIISRFSRFIINFPRWFMLLTCIRL